MKENDTFEFFQKHLDVTLDFKVTYENHLNNVIAKISKTIGFSRKLQNLFPGTTLNTIYKAFVRPRLDYSAVLYDQVFNNLFTEYLESVQYNACLALAGVIMGTSKDEIYQKVGSEVLV